MPAAPRPRLSLAHASKVALICLYFTGQLIAGKLAGNELTQTHKEARRSITVDSDDLGSGKFANGAWTAAFQHLMNAEKEILLQSSGSGADPLPDGGASLPDADRKPPGWTEGWKVGNDARGPHWISPEGEKWYPHPEDGGHWGHYDGPAGSGYPDNAIKPRPGQKRLKPGQSWRDPWGKILAFQSVDRTIQRQMDTFPQEIDRLGTMMLFAVDGPLPLGDAAAIKLLHKP